MHESAGNVQPILWYWSVVKASLECDFVCDIHAEERRETAWVSEIIKGFVIAKSQDPGAIVGKPSKRYQKQAGIVADLRRKLCLTEVRSLQARGDFFNSLNHPNFGNPINCVASPQFGQAIQMLSNFLGSGGQSGGLNPLYQMGPPALQSIGAQAAILTWVKLQRTYCICRTT